VANHGKRVLVMLDDPIPFDRCEVAWHHEKRRLFWWIMALNAAVVIFLWFFS
jgi:hypothetical protein